VLDWGGLLSWMTSMQVPYLDSPIVKSFLFGSYKAGAGDLLSAPTRLVPLAMRWGHKGEPCG